MQTSNDYINIGNIVGLIADTEKNFLTIIIFCYMLFYERFGGFNHRSTKYISFDDYPALCDVKHLRLYNGYAEHGKEKKKRKK